MRSQWMKKIISSRSVTSEIEDFQTSFQTAKRIRRCRGVPFLFQTEEAERTLAALARD